LPESSRQTENALHSQKSRRGRTSSNSQVIPRGSSCRGRARPQSPRGHGGIKTTEENLKEAIDDETYEFEKMYPRFIEEAEKEGEEQAAWSLNVANKVEMIHEQLYKKEPLKTLEKTRK